MYDFDEYKRDMRLGAVILCVLFITLGILFYLIIR